MNRVQTIQQIKEKLTRLTKEREFKHKLEETVHISYGRYSGLFVGSYRGEDGDTCYVEGETRDEVAAIIAEKLEIDNLY